jgi:Zn-dependent protease
MLRSLKIGRAFGIPLYLHPTFLLLPALILLMNREQGWPFLLFTLATLPAIFACVLLHELGHALMARYFGIATRDITLTPLGGIARLERLTDEPAEELLIALAGPAVNVVIALLLLPLVFVGLVGQLLVNPTQAMHLQAATTSQLGFTFLFYLFLGNVMLVVFNMIPAFPMDGGRVFRSVLAMAFGLARATEIAAAVGLVLAGLLSLFALFTGQWLLLFVMLFIAFAGQVELRAVRARTAAAQRAAARYPPAYGPPYQGGPPAPYQGGYDPRYDPYSPYSYQPPAPPRPVPVPPSQADEDIETVVLRPALSGEPARVEAPPPARRAGFSGLVWDRDQEVWVRWEDGRPVAAYR